MIKVKLKCSRCKITRKSVAKDVGTTLYCASNITGSEWEVRKWHYGKQKWLSNMSVYNVEREYRVCVCTFFFFSHIICELWL